MQQSHGVFATAMLLVRYAIISVAAARSGSAEDDGRDEGMYPQTGVYKCMQVDLTLRILVRTFECKIAKQN